MRAFTPFLFLITTGSSLAYTYTQEPLNTTTEFIGKSTIADSAILSAVDDDATRTEIPPLRTNQPDAAQKAIQAIQAEAIAAIQAIEAKAAAAIQAVTTSTEAELEQLDANDRSTVADRIELSTPEQAPEADTDEALARRALQTVQTFSEYTGRQLVAEIISVKSDSLEIRRLADRQIMQLPTAILCAEDQAFATYLWEQKILTESTTAQAEFEPTEALETSNTEQPESSELSQADLELIELLDTLDTLDTETTEESGTSDADMIWEDLF